VSCSEQTPFWTKKFHRLLAKQVSFPLYFELSVYFCTMRNDHFNCSTFRFNNSGQQIDSDMDGTASYRWFCIHVRNIIAIACGVEFAILLWMLISSGSFLCFIVYESCLKLLRVFRQQIPFGCLSNTKYNSSWDFTSEKSISTDCSWTSILWYLFTNIDFYGISFILWLDHFGMFLLFW
jgi:hypothetical protein